MIWSTEVLFREFIVELIDTLFSLHFSRGTWLQYWRKEKNWQKWVVVNDGQKSIFVESAGHRCEEIRERWNSMSTFARSSAVVVASLILVLSLLAGSISRQTANRDHRSMTSPVIATTMKQQTTRTLGWSSRRSTRHERDWCLGYSWYYHTYYQFYCL